MPKFAKIKRATLPADVVHGILIYSNSGDAGSSEFPDAEISDRAEGVSPCFSLVFFATFGLSGLWLYLIIAFINYWLTIAIARASIGRRKAAVAGPYR